MEGREGRKEQSLRGKGEVSAESETPSNAPCHPFKVHTSYLSFMQMDVCVGRGGEAVRPAFNDA